MFERLEHRHGVVVVLGDGLQRVELRRLDADEDGEEAGLPHQLENLGLLGHVERRLAGELQRVAVLLLPGHEMGQHLLRGLAVGDEIVVDEVDDGRVVGLADEGVELGQQLLGRLQPRLPAIERRNVAELAAIRAAGGELQRAEQVFLQRQLVIGRQREIAQRPCARRW